jgi:ABC-type phosphate/phosphonate transport system substrate-binding protein
MLHREGIDPRKDLGGIVLSGDHFKALRDLAAGKCVAAAVSSMELADAPRQGLPADDFIVLARSGELPPVALVARDDVPASLRESIRRAMHTAMDAGVFDQEADLSEQMGTFVECKDADYDLVRELD